MSVLVTGASGNVGGYVVEELLKTGERVTAAGTDAGRLERKFNGRVTCVELDFTKQSTFAAALAGVDRVFLMRPPHLGRPEDLYPFIDAMKDHGITLVSFLSLMGIEKNSVPPHYKIEKYIESSGIPYAHIRPGFFMQNLSGIHAEEIRRQNQIFIPAGKSKASFIDAADIGLAAATVLKDPGRFANTAYTITGSESLDYNQVAEILSEVTGRKITYVRPGFLRYRRYYIKHRGLDKAYVNVTVALYFMTRMGTAQRVSHEFRELTGREPRTFREFAEDNLGCFSDEQ
ncbi:SDR family oxidoreductase [Paenibacillus sp. MMS20-IR301]|uniref:SDR family oxidoreductase n=1 Tax=Paenibacillus sp. MMS20-IR301 TaxID=2895946 RepID=UPI0028E464FC|nr:SDR family oxidoreductase [Paenibacillus sp. MMS20-IR301]WNS43977.1 SDR family oxidoreductase [Paenibacillus sp. MMS20-IR301]